MDKRKNGQAPGNEFGALWPQNVTTSGGNNFNVFLDNQLTKFRIYCLTPDFNSVYIFTKHGAR